MPIRVISVGADGPDTGDFPLPAVVLDELDGRYAPLGGGGGGGGAVDYGAGISRTATDGLTIPASASTRLVLPQEDTSTGTHTSPDVTWNDFGNEVHVQATGLYYVQASSGFVDSTTDAVDLSIFIDTAGSTYPVGPALSARYTKAAGPEDYPYAEVNTFALITAGTYVAASVYSSVAATSDGYDRLQVVRVG